jgi:hypothetical protein
LVRLAVTSTSAYLLARRSSIRFWVFMSDGPIVSRSLRRSCPYRVEQLQPGRFIIVERGTGNVVEAGFVSYAAAWSYIVNESLEGRV